jgi:hypothetical protein
MKCPACEDGAALVPSIGRDDVDLERGVPERFALQPHWFHRTATQESDADQIS